jgi:alkylation response protein AidB-like acyl-CoA dehydrogenase
MPSLEMWLIAGRAVFLIFSFTLAALAFARLRSATLSQTRQLLAGHETVLKRLSDLEARLDATNVCIAKLGERIERPQQVASSAGLASPGYQIAIRLARSGATREELVSQCGLSANEAELVHRLHGPQGAASGRKPAIQRSNAA